MHELVKSLVKKEINLAQFTQKRDELLQIARQMHREEVEEAYTDGFANGLVVEDNIENKKFLKTPKDYYSQTFETP